MSATDPAEVLRPRSPFKKWIGMAIALVELLPLMLSHANRPMFLGHRATPRQTLGLPDHPEPMPLIELPE